MNSVWNQNALIEDTQDFYVAELNEVVYRRGIGDDNH